MQHDLHVLHYAQTPLAGPRAGGLGTMILGLTKEQQLQGVQIKLWCTEETRLVNEVAQQNGLQGALVAFPRTGPPILQYSALMERQALSAVGARFDVAHQHGLWTANSHIMNRWRARFKRPTIVNPQGSLETGALKRSPWKKRLACLFYETQNLRQAACLQAAAEPEIKSFRNYGLTNPVALIPNGIPESWMRNTGDPAHFRRHFALPPEKRIALFVARLHPDKGLPMLFQAIGQAKRALTNWLFVIAGPSERGHEQELRAIVEREQLGDLIRFIGPVWGQEKRNAFAAADLFVLPTHRDSFAITVIEALGAGVPVLATHGAPWSELQTHRCGWWVPTNAAAIQTALLDAAHGSQAELQAMGERGRKLVTSRYVWPKVAEQTIELYQWLRYGGSQPTFVFTT